MFALGVLAVIYTRLTELLVHVFVEDPCLVAVGIVMFAYIIRYFTRIVHRPEILVEQNCKFHCFLKKHCPVLEEEFTPTVWCYGSIAQTLLRPIMQHLLGANVKYKRELLDLPDGGVIGLDHYGHDLTDHNSDIVMMLTGLTGCSDAEYIKQFCCNVRDGGKRAVVMNNRGQGGVELKTCKTYSSTYSDDFECAVKHIRKMNPDCKIMALGISLGGIILTHYVRKAEDPIICGAMAISPPWNAPDAAISLEQPINWMIFNRYLVSLLQEMVESHRHKFEKAGYNIDHVMKSKTIREFDARFTSKVFGYKNNDEYYEAAAFDKKLDTIKIPMIFLNAADDMFCPRHTINDEFLYTSSNVACILTQKGGHIGFMDGLFPAANTYMNRVFTQYMNAIFEHGHELHKVKDGIDTVDDEDTDTDVQIVLN